MFFLRKINSNTSICKTNLKTVIERDWPNLVLWATRSARSYHICQFSVPIHNKKTTLIPGEDISGVLLRTHDYIAFAPDEGAQWTGKNFSKFVFISFTTCWYGDSYRKYYEVCMSLYWTRCNSQKAGTLGAVIFNHFPVSIQQLVEW